MSKVLRIILIILLAVSAILGILFYAGGEDISGQPVYTNTFIVWAYILAGIAVLFAIIFPVMQMLKNPKAAVKSLLGLLVVAVIVFVAYAVSSGEKLGITNPELMQYDVPGTLKYAGTLLNSVYFLAGLAILSMIYAEVSKMFK
jgi:peptidoglycan/LPS O-acetylase OafA/YrhL